MLRRLAVLCLPLLLAACSIKVALTTYTQPVGRFSVLVPEPGTMTYQSRSMKYIGGEVLQHGYATEKDKVVYAVNYFDIPPEINAELRRQRTDYSAVPGLLGMIDANNWDASEIRTAQVRDPAGRTAYGKQFHVNNGKQVLLVKVLWHKDRMYQVILARPAKATYQQETNGDKFFDSFKLI